MAEVKEHEVTPETGMNGDMTGVGLLMFFFDRAS
jgi:hypothetical protein